MSIKTMVCLLLLLRVAASADGGTAQSAIQAAYDRACTALHYKYLDGVMGVRARDYKGYAGGGQPIPMQSEMATLVRLLSEATTVTETTTIEHFVQTNDHEARVRVKDVIEMDRPHGHSPLLIRTVSDDIWTLSGSAWQLKESRIQSQTMDNQ